MQYLFYRCCLRTFVNLVKIAALIDLCNNLLQFIISSANNLTLLPIYNRNMMLRYFLRLLNKYQISFLPLLYHHLIIQAVQVFEFVFRQFFSTGEAYVHTIL